MCDCYLISSSPQVLQFAVPAYLLCGEWDMERSREIFIRSFPSEYYCIFSLFLFFFNLLLNIFFQLWGFVLLFAWVF